MAPKLFRLSQAGILALALAGIGPVAAQAPSAGGTPAPAAAPKNPDTVIARVDGEPITESDLTIAGEDPALSLPGTDAAQKRDILIGYLIDLKLGAKAAEAKKLGDTEAFKKRFAYLRTKLLVDEYIDNETKAAVTPDALRKVYDETVKDMKPEEEVRARHILVEDEAVAKKAYARVKGGEEFAKVADELSKDPGSKKEGGDLGFFTKDRMVAPFAEAAFKLKPNEISEPVKSQFGWHVIQVLERRTKPVAGFDEMKDQIEQYVTRKAQQDTVLALRKTGKVERLEKPAEGAKPAESAEPKK